MRRLLPAAAALLAGWTLWTAPERLFKDEGDGEAVTLNYQSDGERLIHALPGPMISYHLPASGVLSALVFEHSPPALFRFWKLCFVALSLILLYAACAALGAPWGGAVANAGLLLVPSILFLRTGYIHFIQALWAALIAGLWARRERRPSLGRSAEVALAVGSSLLFRSVFAFLPPVLALWSWFGSGRAPRRERLAHAAILLLVPYLFLVPWARMNWTVHRELVLFERGESIPLVILSARGFTGVDYRDSALGDRVWMDVIDGEIHSWRMGPVLRWAARETLSHPARFALAVADRARLIAGQHPLLFLLGVMGLAAFRRRMEFRAVALIAAYFFGIHCLLPYYEEYYPGFWVLALLLISAALAVRLGGADERRAVDRGARTGLRAALALAGLLAAYTVAKVEAYASASPRTSLSSALAGSPNDAWLLAESGFAALAARRFAEAEGLLARALELRPLHPGWSLQRAWARALSGDPRPLLAGGAPADPWSVNPDPHLMRAHVRLKGGEKAAAREELRLAVAMNEDVFESSALAGVEPARRRGLILERARLRWTAVAERAGAVMEPAPAADGQALFEELVRVGRERAAGADFPEARGRFLADIARVERGERHRRALALQDSGDCVRALELFDRLCLENPLEAAYFSDRAICAFRRGDSARAEADLLRAIELDPSLLSSYASLGAIYAAKGSKPRAAAVYDRALATRGGPEDLRELIARTRAALAREP